MQKDFHLPKAQRHIDDFSCAIRRRILLHGRMYISASHIAFKSDVFGLGVRVALPLRDVVKIERSVTNLINPSITVSTSSETHTFASFFFRDHTYRVIVELWKIQLHCHRLLGVPSGPAAADHGGDAPVTPPPSPFAVARGQLCSNSEFAPMGAKPRRNSFDSGAASSRRSEVSPSAQARIPRSASGASFFDPASSAALVAVPASADDAAVAAAAAAAATAIPETESRLDVEPVGVVILNCALPASALDAATILFCDGAHYLPEFMAAQGGTEIHVGPWSELASNGSLPLASRTAPPSKVASPTATACEPRPFKVPSEQVREVRWKVPVRSRLSPIRATRVNEVQCLAILRSGAAVLQIDQVMVDVPYGDYFSVHLKLVLAPAETGDSGLLGCQLSVSARVHFSKSMLLRRKVESSTMAECRENYAKAEPLLLQALERVSAGPPLSPLPAPLRADDAVEPSTPLSRVPPSSAPPVTPSRADSMAYDIAAAAASRSRKATTWMRVVILAASSRIHASTFACAAAVGLSAYVLHSRADLVSETERLRAENLSCRRLVESLRECAPQCADFSRAPDAIADSVSPASLARRSAASHFSSISEESFRSTSQAPTRSA